jgi:hypothetical protein
MSDDDFLDARRWRYIPISGTTSTGASPLLPGDRVKSVSVYNAPGGTGNITIGVQSFALGGPNNVDVAPGESVCLDIDFANVFGVTVTFNAGSSGRYVINVWRPAQ